MVRFHWLLIFARTYWIYYDETSLFSSVRPSRPCNKSPQQKVIWSTNLFKLYLSGPSEQTIGLLMEMQISAEVLRIWCLAVMVPFQWVKIGVGQAKECHLIQRICNPALSNVCILSWGQGGPVWWIKAALLSPDQPLIRKELIILGTFENGVSNARLIKKESNLQSFHNPMVISCGPDKSFQFYYFWW